MKNILKKSVLSTAIICSFMGHAASLDNNNVKESYLITYQQGALPSQYQSLVTKQIATVSKGAIGVITLTKTQAAQLSQIPHIRVEKDVERTIISPYSARSNELQRATQDHELKNFTNPELEYLEQNEITPYGISLTNADKVPEPDNTGVKVCVIDTGIQKNHPEFAQTNLQGNHSDYSGFWFNDAVDHGTHVAGTITANKDGKGVVGVVSNGAVDTYIQKLSKTTAGENSRLRTSHIIEAVEVCANQGAKIINMSLGGSASSDTERDVFDRMAERGILVVAAAGNHGTPASDADDSLSYPASYHNVMSVASVDQNAQLSGFSAVNSAVEKSQHPAVMCSLPLIAVASMLITLHFQA